MPTRNINLTDEQDSFIDEAVRSGRYQNASEAMRDAVRGLQFRMKVEDLKLARLRKELKAGVTALDSGDFATVTDGELETWLDGLSGGRSA